MPSKRNRQYPRKRKSRQRKYSLRRSSRRVKKSRRRGGNRDKPNVLLIGVGIYSWKERFNDLAEELRRGEIYFMSPDAKNLQIDLSTLPPNIHAINEKIPTVYDALHLEQKHMHYDSWPEMPVPELFFHTIIVDWSTIQSMSRKALAHFIAMYLRKDAGYSPLDGVFMRGLAEREYSNRTSGDSLGYFLIKNNLDIKDNNGDLKDLHELYNGWTTQDYLKKWNMPHYNYTVYKLYKEDGIEVREHKPLGDDEVWAKRETRTSSPITRISSGDVIKLYVRGNLQNLHELISYMAQYGLLCHIADKYPLKNDKGMKITKGQEVLSNPYERFVNCRWTSIKPETNPYEYADCGQGWHTDGIQAEDGNYYQYWYNQETHESVWEKPSALRRRVT